MPLTKNRRCPTKVNKERLRKVLESAIASQGSTEYAVLHLFRHYDIDLHELQRVLQEKGLSVSFSKVTYKDVAPMVGLSPTTMGVDMETFDIFRARLPTDMIYSMMEDLQTAWKQYGSPDFHFNEETQSRCISPLFNRTVALFNLTIRNASEPTIPGRLTTQGRIEYYFVIFRGLSLLVIQVQYRLPTPWERLNTIAQVIAECDTCDYINSRKKFPDSLVYGILCDGQSFEFYSFDGSTTPPTFARGVIPTSPPHRPFNSLPLPTYKAVTDFALMQSLRRVCETIFYLLLLSYTSGLDSYCKHSVTEATHDMKRRRSSPNWKQARDLGMEARELAVAAAAKASNGDPAALTMTTDALDRLQKSVDAVPESHEDIDFLSSWDKDRMEYC